VQLGDDPVFIVHGLHNDLWDGEDDNASLGVGGGRRDCIDVDDVACLGQRRVLAERLVYPAVEDARGGEVWVRRETPREAVVASGALCGSDRVVGDILDVCGAGFRQARNLRVARPERVAPLSCGGCVAESGGARAVARIAGGRLYAV
jgi:hypothetical protein